MEVPIIICTVFDDFGKRIAELDLAWVWFGAIGMLLYAIWDFKDTWDEIKSAKGYLKIFPVLKMILLLSLVVFAIFSAWAASINTNSDREKIDGIDPLNKPIVSISAKLRFKAKGDIHTYRLPQDPFDARSRMIFLRGHAISNGLGGPLVLVAGGNNFAILNNLDTQDDPLDRDVIVQFEMQRDPVLRSIVGDSYNVRAGVFNEVASLIVELPQMGTNVIVTSGDVAVEVNSSLIWKFPIPLQRQGPTGYPPTDELPYGGFGFISSKINTNADNKIEASVLPFPINDWAVPPRWTNVLFDGK